MRVIFNEELKAVADDLDHMVKGVRKAINGAGDALLNQNLEAAQAVIDGDIEIDALEASVVDQCVKLLAKQNPVATDLRVVVSTMRLATTFERMGDLARHIAEAARRTYPASPLPAEAQPLFAEMQAFLNDVADQTVSSGCMERFAFLYGSRILRTSSTTSLAFNQSSWIRLVSPMRPMREASVPSERWSLNP